jgi:hypothetical protein
MKNIYYICIIWFSFSHFAISQSLDSNSTFILPRNDAKIHNDSDIDPLIKRLKLVTIVDSRSWSIDREMEVWKAIMGSVDLEHIGFVFLVQPLEKIDVFKKYWFDEKKMDYPFYYDAGNKLFESNRFSEEKSRQTILIDEDDSVVLVGGSPIRTDPFNLYRSTLHHLTSEMGIKRAVRGVIVEEKDGIVKSFYSSDPIYVTEEGGVLPAKRAKEFIISKKFIPQSSPLTDTVLLIKRNFR